MALQGNLKELRLGDVLQTVLASGHDGILRVRSGGRRAVIHLSAGGLHVIEPDVLDERLVVEGFVARGLLAREHMLKALKQGGSLVGHLLETGKLDANMVGTVLTEAAEDAVLDVFAWDEGEFRFEEGAQPAGDMGPVAAVALEPGSLLLKAAQRVDERRALAQVIGVHAVLLVRVSDRTCAPALPDATLLEQVLGALDGRALLSEIALSRGVGLFATQRAASALVESGHARLPTPEELTTAAKLREAAADVRGALALLRQWQGARPLETEPYLAAAELARRADRLEDETDSLRALGHTCLKIGQAKDAREAFAKLLIRRPGDRDALDGLRVSAKEMGDGEGYVKATRDLAERALEAGDAAAANAVLAEVIGAFPEDIASRILRTKALMRLGDKAHAICEFERMAELLPVPCRRRADREAATWCRETLPHLVPDRSDLLRAFRERLENGNAGRKRALILGAFVLACSGVGFALWPRSAGSLLAKAQAARDKGDTATASALASEIVDRYPDSEEFDRALALKVSLAPRTQPTPAAADSARERTLEQRTLSCVEALAHWPDAKAVAEADTLAQLVVSLDASQDGARKASGRLIALPLADALNSLRVEAIYRRDALDTARLAVAKPPATLDAFRTVVERAEAALDPTWPETGAAALAAAKRLVSALGLEALLAARLPADVRAAEDAVASIHRAVGTRRPDVEAARREHHRLVIFAAYEKARIDASGLLVRGSIDAAEAHYARLRALVDQVDDDEILRPLKEGIDRRGIREFALSKTAMMGTIREGLAAAKAAEDGGNLGGAAGTYAALVQQFPLVRFDEVFTIPVRVTTVPPGALVSVNGKEVGPSPCVIRYGWGSQVVVNADASGFETASLALATAEPHPKGEARITLMPTARWSRPLVGTYEAPPVEVDGDLLVASRNGRVERRSSATGELVWSVDTGGVEGVRGRSVVLSGIVHVPLLDGTVARLDVSTGFAHASWKLESRPVGDAAKVGNRIAFALDDRVAIYGEDGRAVYARLPGMATTGVLADHGAFWVGDARGGIDRVDPLTGALTTIPSGGKEPVVGIAAGTGFLYALTGDGTLLAVEAKAATASVAWRRPGVGDAAGSPVEAGSYVAVADRRGLVRLFSTADGTPRGERDAGAALVGGLQGFGGRLAASLADGRVWLWDARTDAVVLDLALRGTVKVPPTRLADGTLIVPAGANGLSAFPMAR